MVRVAGRFFWSVHEEKARSRGESAYPVYRG